MLNIEYIENLDEELDNFVGNEFEGFAIKNDIICNYNSFNFIAKENDKVIGILSGHSYYKEVFINNLIILEEYRNKDIGSKLIKMVEDHYKDKDFENINVATYNFQAPEFYKKCGFEIEFKRENKKNPKLTKYFLIKYF